jgi:hypothetical protein
MNTKQTPGASELTRENAERWIAIAKTLKHEMFHAYPAEIIALCEHYLRTTAAVDLNETPFREAVLSYGYRCVYASQLQTHEQVTWRSDAFEHVVQEMRKLVCTTAPAVAESVAFKPTEIYTDNTETLRNALARIEQLESEAQSNFRAPLLALAGNMRKQAFLQRESGQRENPALLEMYAENISAVLDKIGEK